MKSLKLLFLASALPAALFGQITAVGVNTGVATDLYAVITGQNLVITVDNTTAVGVTGTVTSFGFNTPFAPGPDLLGKIQTSYTVLSATGPESPWTEFSSFTLTAGLGGGGVTVDFGVAADDNPSPGGGNPHNGIAWGEKVQFTFTFDNSLALSPYEGFDEDGFSYLPLFFNQSPGYDFLMRWQQVAGSTAGTSDAAGLDWYDGYDIPQGGGVPEPSTYGLIAAIVALFALELRRFRR